MISKFSVKIRPSQDKGIFHDSRADIRLVVKYCTALADKVNELVDEVNELRKENEELKKENEHYVNTLLERGE